jgi:hypothetical protein
MAADMAAATVAALVAQAAAWPVSAPAAAVLCARDLSALLQREAVRGVHPALDLACLQLLQVVVASLLFDERRVLAPVRLVLAVARPHAVTTVAVGKTCTQKSTC